MFIYMNKVLFCSVLFCNRLKQAVVNRSMSQPNLVTEASGVLQGTVIGPFFFAFHMHHNHLSITQTLNYLKVPSYQ